MLIQIVPQNPTTLNRCAICLEDNNILDTHPCTRCSKDAWKICKDCLSQINDCPVCRLKNINNNNETARTSQLRLFLEKLCECLQFPAFFICIIYLGKVYIYVSCHISKCPPEEDDKCLCHRFLERDNYWGDFRYCISEMIIGLIYTCILAGLCLCCCKS